MDEDYLDPYLHHIPRPYYLPHFQRSPFVLSRPYLEDSHYHEYYSENKKDPTINIYNKRIKFFQNSFHYLRLLAYAQIFIGGILLVTDVSRIVLLWNFIKFHETKVEMICQISFPLFCLIVGFLCLASVLTPSYGLTRMLTIILVTAIVPNFVWPKQAVFLTTALEAMEVSRASDRSLWRDATVEETAGMIRSETHNKLARMLSLSITPGQKWPLGIQDLTSVPLDFLLVIQYLLVSYALLAFIQIVLYIFTLYILVRLLND